MRKFLLKTAAVAAMAIFVLASCTKPDDTPYKTVEKAQVRFKKDYAYQNVTQMRVISGNGTVVASYNFGTNEGTSSYYEITAGGYVPQYYYSDNTWNQIFDYTFFDFKNKHKYTVLCSSDANYLIFNVIDDGTY